MSNIAAASGLAVVTLFMIVSLLTVGAGHNNEAQAPLAATEATQANG